MVTVDNQPAVAGGVSQRRADHTRRAAVHRRHGVEQVGKTNQALGECGLDVLIGRLGVASRNRYTAGNQLRNRARWHRFRRERNQRGAG